MLCSLKQSGQGMVEYALILALIAIVALFGMTMLGGLITNLFITINNCSFLYKNLKFIPIFHFLVIVDL